MCTQGGSAIMDTIDHFSSTYCLLVVGLMECVVKQEELMERVVKQDQLEEGVKPVWLPAMQFSFG